MIRRRELLSLLGATAVAWPLAARGQQAERMRRIAVLMTSADDADGRARLAAFQNGLRELGWRNGVNVRIDVRWGAADTDRIRAQAGEILALRPEAILATSGRVVRILHQEIRDLPIVFVGPVDPVGAGFVESLARPGGNITGFTSVESSFAGKWLEMLKEMVPPLARVALVFGPDNPSAAGYRKVLEVAAPSLGIKVFPLSVRTAAEVESAVEGFAREPNGGLILPLDLTVSAHRELLAAVAARHRIPAISGYQGFATAGGLMSYGPDLPNLYERAAAYFDRILRGEKPADLPVQAPTKYQFVLNIRTVKALGLFVPPSLLARADEVIE